MVFETHPVSITPNGLKPEPQCCDLLDRLLKAYLLTEPEKSSATDFVKFARAVLLKSPPVSIQPTMSGFAFQLSDGMVLPFFATSPEMESTGELPPANAIMVTGTNQSYRPGEVKLPY